MKIKTNNTNYSYVWVIFKGDKYIPGAIVSAYSVKRTKPIYDLVCLITNDVSENAKINLSKVFDYIINIDYIKNKEGVLKSKQQKKIYDSWINVSYTKWNILGLTQYEKVFMLDADTIITQNIDHIFDLDKEAGTFMNVWSDTYKKGSIVKDYYKNKKIITPDKIKYALNNNGFAVIASSILLKPNKQYFNNYKKMLSNENISKEFTGNNFSGFDESSLLYFMSIYEKGPKLSWINLNNCYQYIPWKNNHCCKLGETKLCNKIKVIHYFGIELPWEIDYSYANIYQDLMVWLSVCKEMLVNTDVRKNIFKYPNSIIQKKIYYNKYFNLFPKLYLPLLVQNKLNLTKKRKFILKNKKQTKKQNTN